MEDDKDPELIVRDEVSINENHFEAHCTDYEIECIVQVNMLAFDSV